MRSQRDTAHLVFVHPQNERDQADLMNSGAFVLDMESDSCVGIQGDRYAFIDHLFNVIGHDGDTEDLAEMDTAFAELLGRRFLGAAPSLEMCNALYLIYKAGKGATGSKTDVLNAISHPLEELKRFLIPIILSRHLQSNFCTLFILRYRSISLTRE